MGKANYILAIDEGTTGITAHIYNRKEEVVASAYSEIPQIFPHPGWVEHDAGQIWHLTEKVIHAVLQKGKIKPTAIAAIGITNQRETFLLWDKRSSKPQGHAIVWQCRRSGDYCSRLKAKGMEPWIQKKTGLRIDPYFSLTKLKLYFDQHKHLKKLAQKGEVLFGTMDSWLLWNLTGGVIHATDWTNASRTMMFNIKKLCWDNEILKEFHLPQACLPQVLPSIEIFGFTKGLNVLPDGIPISGIAGDQQAAMIGQNCFRKGEAKNTYGTGCFLLQHTGNKPVFSKKGLLTSLAASGGDGAEYVLEGSIFIAGAAVQWLRDGLNFIKHSKEAEKLALSVPDTHGVMVVPAFVGLGAPYWRSDVRGAIMGLTRGANQAHITRAVLEAIAFQTRDVFETIQHESGFHIPELRIDGGATENNFLMQFQADLLNVPLHRPKNRETTVKGAALLAGLGVGFWRNKEELVSKQKWDKSFKPQKRKHQQALELYHNWSGAVQTLIKN